MAKNKQDRRQIRTLGSVLLGALLLSMLTACGNKAIGYAVLYWTPDEAKAENGASFPVLKRSSISETLRLETAEDPDGWAVDDWRMGFYEKQEAAQQEADRYQSFRHLAAISQKDRLAIRKEADLSSERVYVLRKGQQIKVLGKVEKTATVGQYQGYWYRVLTEDGVYGYCFDHYLEVFDLREGPKKKVSPELSFIQEAFARNYRPEAFLEMIQRRQVDLERFQTKYGLFPMLEEKQIRMELEDLSRVFSYDEIEVTSNGSYAFSGSGLTVNFFSDDSLAAVFPIEGKTNSERFRFISEEEFQKAISGEQKRRKELRIRFADGGGLFAGSAYGSIQFDQNGRFSWTEKNRLIPEILPEGSSDEGTYHFDHFLSPQLRRSYDGVINLSFDSSREHFIFLYQLDGNKLRLSTANERTIEDKIVKQPPYSPLVMAFTRDFDEEKTIEQDEPQEEEE